MDTSIPLESCAVRLMPHVSEILPKIPVPLAVWANTQIATGNDLEGFLDKGGIGRFFSWIVTSVDAGFRKPAPQFFDFALGKCGLARGSENEQPICDTEQVSLPERADLAEVGKGCRPRTLRRCSESGTSRRLTVIQEPPQSLLPLPRHELLGTRAKTLAVIVQ
jgi:hypothetical protein